MRKQKASDRRTRRRQRGGADWQQEQELRLSFSSTVAESPMEAVGAWNLKQAQVPELGRTTIGATSGIAGGRGRSRKRSTFYNALAFYHNTYFKLLTQEYQAEEDEVLGRIKASLDNPLDLEIAGFALYDMVPQRRGNLFGDEVYRLVKAPDATTTYSRLLEDEGFEGSFPNSPTPLSPKNRTTSFNIRYLPSNHKFTNNDVVMITVQPQGSGDFFSPSTLPTSDDATSVEARVLGLGPTYLDVIIPAGQFEAAFGPAPNDRHNGGNPILRVRADRFVSNVPYQRMVAAVAQATHIPDRQKQPSANLAESSSSSLVAESVPAHGNIRMDEVLREAILSTFAFANPYSPLLQDPDVCDLQELSNKLAKPPMRSSVRLAAQVMKHIRNNPLIFRELNAPQKSAIEAALTRRLTLIQGPPGTGKTVVASAIAFGFVHQCRTISPHTKPLACAFSNVGADNLAEALVRLGLRIVRIGKPSGVSETLWNCTLDAAIDRDLEAQKALEKAARATSLLRKAGNAKGNTAASSSEQSLRDAATLAVKASIQACNVAATKALREADVIVSTSTGAADPRLLAACGIALQGAEASRSSFQIKDRAILPRENAPDGLPPLSLPFVIIDEACQSVEPASLVPIVSSDSCRSVVMLGDPCQLPPTVRNLESSPLSVSLMERLSAILPHPIVTSQVDSTLKDLSFLDTLPIRQAKSLMKSRQSDPSPRSYRKRFPGSLLLSVQYRMHPSIAAFPSAIFYDGQLSTPSSLASQRPLPWLNEWMPCGNPHLRVRVLDVGGRGNERQGTQTRFTRTVFGATGGGGANGEWGDGAATEEQTTYWNDAEAERVLSLIKEVVQREGSSTGTRAVRSIGVISPYNGQVSLIKSMMARDAELREGLRVAPMSIEVRSVDGYQGRERDVVVFSAVRSNRQGRIGFLRDWRRLNVALTRARVGLLVVGDMDTLAEGDRHWAAFSKWSLSSRCVVNDYDGADDEPST